MANVANTRYYAKGITGNALHDNGAAAIYAGTVAGNNVTKSVGKEGVGTVKRLASRVPLPTETGSDYTAKGVSGGDFANNHVGRYLISGTVAYIAGVASTVLSKPGASPILKWSINRREGRSITLQRNAGWNYVTGAFLTTPTVSAVTYKAIDGTSNVDRAARTTRTAPGNVYYMVGKTPTVKALAGRTQ